MSAFSDWHNAVLAKIEADRSEILRTGETDEIKPKRKRLEKYVNKLAEMIARKDIPPLEDDDGPDRISLMPYRTADHCGWSIGAFPYKGEELDLSAKRFDTEAQIIKHQYRDDFEDAFNFARSKNYYIESSDDPQKLSMGFTVFSGDGLHRHIIRRGDYNAPSKDQLKKQGFMP